MLRPTGSADVVWSDPPRDPVRSATLRGSRDVPSAAAAPAVPPDARPTLRLAALVALLALAGTAPPARAQRPAPPPSTRRPAAGVPWWADSARWDARVVRRRDVRLAERRVDAGDTLHLPAPALPAALPDSLRARGVRWSSDDEQVAAVEPDGRVVARAPGRALVLAWTAAGTTTTPLVVRPAVRGRVRDHDGRPLAGARIAARIGAWRDSARTAADGSFHLRPPDHADGPAEVRVAPNPGWAVPRHPTRLAAVAPARAARLDVVLLPTEWSIAGGTFHGATVAVRPDLALGAGRFWRLTEAGAPVGWASSAPFGVALVDEPGLPLLASDTAAFWRAARDLERDWGRPLFHPAPPDDAVITVRPGDWLAESGLTTASWGADGTIPSATITLRSRAIFHDRHVVAHELAHALGFGHAPAWPSLLAPRDGARRATAHDVAHAQLWEALRRLQGGGPPPDGLAGAGT